MGGPADSHEPESLRREPRRTGRNLAPINRPGGNPLVSGTSPGGMVSVSVLTITQGVSRAMLIHKSTAGGNRTVRHAGAWLGCTGPRPASCRQAPAWRARTGRGISGSPPSTTLRLAGTTDYDPAVLTIVRTLFDGRVDSVLVDLGSTVKPGDPLAGVVQHRSGRRQERVRDSTQPACPRQENRSRSRPLSPRPIPSPARN